MASVNKVIIIGNLGRDPEVRAFPSGDRVANVTIATTETWKDKQTGERREATEWHRVVFRGGLACIVEKYLRKGSQVYVEGSIKTRKYSDAAGVEKQIVEIMASEMTMLGQRQAAQEGGDQAHTQQAAPSARAPAPSRPAPAPRQGGGSGFDDMDDDIPFNDPLKSRAFCLAI